MNYKMYALAVCVAWSVVMCADSKSIATATKTVKPAGGVKVQPLNNAIDAQKVLADMKKRLDGNRKMLGTLKGEWQQKREALQKKLATSKAKSSVTQKSGANVVKPTASTKVVSAAAPKKAVATTAIKKA